MNNIINNSDKIKEVRDKITSFNTNRAKITTKLKELNDKIQGIEKLKGQIDTVKTDITDLKGALAVENGDNNISGEDEVKNAFLEAIGDDSGNKGSVDIIIENV